MPRSAAAGAKRVVHCAGVEQPRGVSAVPALLQLLQKLLLRCQIWMLQADDEAQVLLRLIVYPDFSCQRTVVNLGRCGPRERAGALARRRQA